MIEKLKLPEGWVYPEDIDLDALMDGLTFTLVGDTVKFSKEMPVIHGAIAHIVDNHVVINIGFREFIIPKGE